MYEKRRGESQDLYSSTYQIIFNVLMSMIAVSRKRLSHLHSWPGSS